MYDWSRVIAVLSFIVQIANFAMVFVASWKPEWAIVIAAFVAGIQAFTGRIQGTPNQ